MERVESLRKEATALRQIADRCNEAPEFRRKIIELAEMCERLAQGLGATIEKTDNGKSGHSKSNGTAQKGKKGQH